MTSCAPQITLVGKSKEFKFWHSDTWHTRCRKDQHVFILLSRTCSSIKTRKKTRTRITCSTKKKKNRRRKMTETIFEAYLVYRKLELSILWYLFRGQRLYIYEMFLWNFDLLCFLSLTNSYQWKLTIIA